MRRVRDPVRNILIFLAYLAVVPAGCVGTLGLTLWLSVESHEFGPWDPRYLLLFYGSTVEEMGLIGPVRDSARYSAQGQDGTAPSFANVSFKTMVLPERIIEIYEARCSKIGLVPRRILLEAIPHEDDKSGLECTHERGQLEVSTKRVGNLTEVNIGGWEFLK